MIDEAHLLTRRSFLRLNALTALAGLTLSKFDVAKASIAPVWLIGIGNSITYGIRATRNRGYFYMLSSVLGIPAFKCIRMPKKKGVGILNYLLYPQSVMGLQKLDSNLLTGSGLIVCTTGIKELNTCLPERIDIVLNYILTNTQAIADWWASMRPGSEMIVLPPVDNGSNQQGMSRSVTDAFIGRLHYPAIVLDWFTPKDVLHNLGQPESWWDNWAHPNTAGHVAIKDVIVNYLSS